LGKQHFYAGIGRFACVVSAADIVAQNWILRYNSVYTCSVSDKNT
jgi:hypothetical protein